ncbi:MAG: S49 family peptidase [Betaproteobacteria bacterium]|nr:MAG: S49 family peptidase [Betaproteobacteria bacterium]
MEDKTIERLADAYLGELRRQRRGRFWWRFAFFTVLLLTLLGWWGDDQHPGGMDGAHTALIEIHGEIGGQEGVVADAVIYSLNEAFNGHQVKGVVLRINSPGGSPVAAGQIYDEIRRQRALHPNIPVYTVVDEICASGGYYIAAATDKIFVDKASLVGSIGVLMDGFGFTEVMKKVGVERRLLTAGESKGFLDPFSPRDATEEQHARQLLAEAHTQFIDAVREGRGKRLKAQPGVFSGLIWHGASSIKLGLADGLGSLEFVAREVVKAEEIVDYTQPEDLADRLTRQLGVAIGTSLKPWTTPRLH